MTICAHFASILIHDKILLYILWNWIKSMKSNCSSHLFISTFLHKGLYLHRQSINVCRLLLLSKYMNFYVFFWKKYDTMKSFPRTSPPQRSRQLKTLLVKMQGKYLVINVKQFVKSTAYCRSPTRTLTQAAVMICRFLWQQKKTN